MSGGGHFHPDSKDKFGLRVAWAMAIISAILGGITLLSHRAHTLSIRLSAEANILHTKSNDMWNWYQAKKYRLHQYEMNKILFTGLAKDKDSNDEVIRVTRDWSDLIAKYQVELPIHAKKAEDLGKQAEQTFEDGKTAHHRADRIDLAEIIIELAVLAMSVAILTHQIAFVIAGGTLAVVSITILATAFL
jgi:hypothetical protein